MNIFHHCWLDIFPTFKWILCKLCKTINMLQRTICRWAKIFHWIMCRGIKCLPTKMIIFHDNTITLGYRCHKRLNQMRLGKESPSFLIPVHCWGLGGGGLVASFPRRLLLSRWSHNPSSLLKSENRTEQHHCVYIWRLHFVTFMSLWSSLEECLWRLFYLP